MSLLCPFLGKLQELERQTQGGLKYQTVDWDFTFDQDEPSTPLPLWEPVHILLFFIIGAYSKSLLVP